MNGLRALHCYSWCLIFLGAHPCQQPLESYDLHTHANGAGFNRKCLCAIIFTTLLQLLVELQYDMTEITSHHPSTLFNASPKKESQAIVLSFNSLPRAPLQLSQRSLPA